MQAIARVNARAAAPCHRRASQQSLRVVLAQAQPMKVRHAEHHATCFNAVQGSVGAPVEASTSCVFVWTVGAQREGSGRSLARRSGGSPRSRLADMAHRLNSHILPTTGGSDGRGGAHGWPDRQEACGSQGSI
jgi:hypothetical protein